MPAPRAAASTASCRVSWSVMRPCSTSRAPVTSQAGSGRAKPSRAVQPSRASRRSTVSASAGVATTWRGASGCLVTGRPRRRAVREVAKARAAASVRVRAPSLRMPARMWVSTVSARDAELPGDAAGGFPGGDQPQHVGLPAGELVAGAGAAGVAVHVVAAQAAAGPAGQHGQARPRRRAVRRPAARATARSGSVSVSPAASRQRTCSRSATGCQPSAAAANPVPVAQAVSVRRAGGGQAGAGSAGSPAAPRSCAAHRAVIACSPASSPRAAAPAGSRAARSGCPSSQAVSRATQAVAGCAGPASQVGAGGAEQPGVGLDQRGRRGRVAAGLVRAAPGR